MSDTVIQVMTEADLPGAMQCMSDAFGLEPFPEPVRTRMSDGLELDRMRVARDGDRVVATAGAYSLQLSMPDGGTAPVAGVTMVSVAATARRRGLLRSLMTTQLRELAEAGEPVAALWASEAAIYQHYGYGLAAYRQLITPPRGLAFRPHATALVAAFREHGRIRTGSWDDDLPALGAVYDRCLHQRPGQLTRPAGGRSWARLAAGSGERPPLLVVAEGPDGPSGYAVYTLSSTPSTSFAPHVTVTVNEVMAADPATQAALWRFLLDLDLAGSLVCRNRPVPDPVGALLVDHRRLNGLIGDCLWLRLADLPRALAGRTMAAELDVVLDVTDDLIAANAGRWRVTAAAGAAPSVTRATGPGDLGLDIADLAAVHLGAVSLAELALAGRVIERRPGVLAAATTAWSCSPAAWCPEIF